MADLADGKVHQVIDCDVCLEVDDRVEQEWRNKNCTSFSKPKTAEIVRLREVSREVVRKEAGDEFECSWKAGNLRGT
jgi:hypothetical protein